MKTAREIAERILFGGKAAWRTCEQEGVDEYYFHDYTQKVEKLRGAGIGGRMGLITGIRADISPDKIKSALKKLAKENKMFSLGFSKEGRAPRIFLSQDDFEKKLCPILEEKHAKVDENKAGPQL